MPRDDCATSDGVFRKSKRFRVVMVQWPLFSVLLLTVIQCVSQVPRVRYLVDLSAGRFVAELPTTPVIRPLSIPVHLYASPLAKYPDVTVSINHRPIGTLSIPHLRLIVHPGDVLTVGAPFLRREVFVEMMMQDPQTQFVTERMRLILSPWRNSASVGPIHVK